MARGFHILIVEDEPSVLDALQTTLETRYRVSSASTVQEARAVLQTSQIDVALVDSILPDGRGDDVAAFAEGIGATVIEMTGYSPEHVGLDASDRQHLFKPFGANVLLSTVAFALHEDRRRIAEGEDCISGEARSAPA